MQFHQFVYPVKPFSESSYASRLNRELPSEIHRHVNIGSRLHATSGDFIENGYDGCSG
jgi:hypothetical protein